ncbi:MAG: hypothetical protein H7Z19_09060 [Chitinophagaceae bacterium]|nr:hypothetical protein [Rubrivivax sp.]
MYESRDNKPLTRQAFTKRLLVHLAAAVLLLTLSLSVGIWGYMQLENLPAMDAFLNAAMLLGGMGPVDPPATAGGKLFAGLYALYAGLLFIFSTVLICAPILHRVLHMFHADDQDL